MTRALIAVFARAPRPGRTKTRLIPALGAEGAARLYAAFLDDTLAKAAAAAAVQIWAADPQDAEALAVRYPAHAVHAQPEGDLGRRMEATLAAGLRTHERVVLIGSDAPTLPTAHLAASFEALEAADAVLGPVADGGFVLVGARGEAPSFGDVRWSTRHALGDTLAAFAAQGRRTARIRPWYDVDTPRDLEVLRLHLALRPHAAPATADALRDADRAAPETRGFDRDRPAG